MSTVCRVVPLTRLREFFPLFVAGRNGVVVKHRSVNVTLSFVWVKGLGSNRSNAGLFACTNACRLLGASARLPQSVVDFQFAMHIIITLTVLLFFPQETSTCPHVPNTHLTSNLHTRIKSILEIIQQALNRSHIANLVFRLPHPWLPFKHCTLHPLSMRGARIATSPGSPLSLPPMPVQACFYGVGEPQLLQGENSLTIKIPPLFVLRTPRVAPLFYLLVTGTSHANIISLV